MTLATDSILPPEPDAGPDGPFPVLHDREYRVRAFRLAADRMLIQGAIRDQKPPGLYLRGDPDPLTIHHMQLSLVVSYPELEIVAAETSFRAHPRPDCPAIVDRYDELVGLSIGRGFTHRIRELFGGPRGCTHTTALLQAMAPVAVQCVWSMRAVDAELAGEPEPMLDPRRNADDTWRRNINTCHVWAEEGHAVADRMAGVAEPAPVFLQPRLERLGITIPAASADD